MTRHAKLSPSSAHRWMTCPGSVVLEALEPDSSSAHADEGTSAHEFAACDLVGSRKRIGSVTTVNGADWVLTDEMARHIKTYCDVVRGIAQGAPIRVEQRLDISGITGEEGAKGTADAVILLDDEIVVVDLKYGQGVKVDARENSQLMIYALAALDEYGLVQEFKSVRLIIVQPRLGRVDEWTCSVEGLEVFREQVAQAAMRVGDAELAYEAGADLAEFLTPGEDACRFCRAAARCPALAQHVLTTVADDFVDLTQPIGAQLNLGRTIDNPTLGNLFGAVPLIEKWCDVVRAKVTAELLAGQPVPGWKAVAGRLGNRSWRDTAEAESTLKAMKLKQDEMYEFKVISPTTAEKLAKDGVIGPRQWPKLQDLITRAEGKPAIVPETDPRPAIAVLDEFEDLTEEPLV